MESDESERVHLWARCSDGGVQHGLIKNPYACVGGLAQQCGCASIFASYREISEWSA